MATNYSWNWTATATHSVPIKTATYETEFVRRESKRNDQVVLANLTSPADAVETVRFAYQSVANVYSGTRIDPAYYAGSKAGFSILGQTNMTYIGEDETIGYRVLLPVSAHFVLRAPSHPAVTGDVLLEAIGRLLGLLSTSGTGTDAEGIRIRLAALARGAVLPRQLI